MGVLALVDFGGNEILNIQRFLQRFLNLLF